MVHIIICLPGGGAPVYQNTGKPECCKEDPVLPENQILNRKKNSPCDPKINQEDKPYCIKYKKLLNTNLNQTTNKTRKPNTEKLN